MTSLVPTRHIWPALQELLCDYSFALSNYSFENQVEPNLKLLASRLDTMERLLAHGGVCGGFEGVIRSLLQKNCFNKIWENETHNKLHYMCLSHLLLAYRVLGVLSSPTAAITYRPQIFSRTLTVAPQSRVYNLMHLSSWPKTLRMASSQVDAYQIRSHLDNADRLGVGGGATLASRLEVLGNLKDTQNIIACLQNVQTAAIHLLFLLHGCTSQMSEKPDIFFPDLPSTPELFIQETERISGIQLSPSARQRIEGLVQNNLPNLRIQLLSAALISPIFLFQPFVMECKSWSKQSLIETSFRLGNDPPPVIREVHGRMWHMLKRLALSRDAGSLVQEVSDMFADIPWDKFDDDVISAKARDWFKCEVLSSGKAKKKGTTSSGSRSSLASTGTTTLQVDIGHPPVVENPNGLTPPQAGIQSRPVSGSPDMSMVDAAPSHVDVELLPVTPKKNKKRQNRKNPAGTTGGDDDQDPDYEPVKRQKRAHQPTDTSLLDQGIPSTTAEHERGATITPVQNNDHSSKSPEAQLLQVAPLSGLPSPMQPASPTMLSSEVSAAPSTALESETIVQSIGIVTPPVARLAPDSPVDAPDRQPMVPDLLVKKQSTPSAAGRITPTMGGSYHEPIDVEAYDAHQCPRVPDSVAQPFLTSRNARVQEASEFIIEYAIDGNSLALYVPYIRPDALAMIRDALAHVAHYPDEALHSIDAYDGGNRSMFLDWDLQTSRRGIAYKQRELRWNVLLFSTPRPSERTVTYQDFKTIALQAIDRYGNEIIVHDLSVSDDPNDPLRVQIGTVAESMLDFKRRQNIYHIPPIPSSRVDDFFDRLYCSETIAYEATHPRSAKFHLFQNPAQALSYRTATLAGGIDYWQMAPSGLGVAITVEHGELHIVVADPGDAALFTTSALLSMHSGAAAPLRGKHEAVWLRGGNRIVIPPCTLYFTWAVKDTVCHKRYFYSSVHMLMTQTALAHSLVLGAMASRDPVTPAVAFPVLCRTMICWHAFLTTTAAKSGPSRLAEKSNMPPEDDLTFHLPDLDDIESVLDLFALINTIILMPVYDSRMYASGSLAQVEALSESERMLFILAHQRALQVSHWFFEQYRLLSPAGDRYLDGKEEFWALSLLHHANVLLRYKLLAERKKPQFSTACTVNELQQQIRCCLKPFGQDIDNLSGRFNTRIAPEGCKMAVFLDEEGLQQMNDDPDHSLPLALWNSSRGWDISVPLPSVEKRVA